MIKPNRSSTWLDVHGDSVANNYRVFVVHFESISADELNRKRLERATTQQRKHEFIEVLFNPTAIVA